jgi:hypothetical protein
MASFLKFTINTPMTGEAEITLTPTDEDAIRILTGLAGAAAPITDTREVPNPSDPTQTITETYERPRTVREALRDEVMIFAKGIESKVASYEEAERAKAPKITPPVLSP